MKKIVSGILSLVLTVMGFVALSMVSVAPASANTGSIGYCQATASDRNPYNFITASIDSLLDNEGNLKQGGINANDVVPKFSYITKANVRKYFEGQNTTKSTLTAADCPGGPELVIAKPEKPSYVPPTCSTYLTYPYGQVTFPADLGTGVASHSEAVLSDTKKVLSTYYTLKADTMTEFYQWDDVMGETKTYAFNTQTIADVNDPLYIVDSKTGIGTCELSNTGFMGLDTKVTIVGGLIGLGILFLIGNAVVRRRNA
jgi:hypothetical protein